MLKVEVSSLSQVRVLVDPQLTSKIENHREILRANIKNENAHYSSLSHCHLASGFAVGDSPVGFDLEDARRLTKPLILRVATAEEQQTIESLDSSNRLADIWVAKEAAWKCFNRVPTLKNPPKLISELTIQFQGQNGVTQFRCEWQGTKVIGEVQANVANIENLAMAVCLLSN